MGRPLATAIRAAAEQAREVLVAPEDAGWTAAALPEWSLEEATLFVRSDQVALPVFTENEARHITREELAASSGVPAGLREELLVEAAAGHLVASYANRRPVAFCYPSSLTEQWWDVSIDTLPDRPGAGLGCRRVERGVRQPGPEARVPGHRPSDPFSRGS